MPPGGEGGDGGARWRTVGEAEGEPQVQVCRMETAREQENRANGGEATKLRPAG